MEEERKKIIIHCSDGVNVEVPPFMTKYSTMIQEFDRIKDDNYWPEGQDDEDVLKLIDSCVPGQAESTN